MSDLTKTFVVSLVTAAATSVVVYVLMARFDPRFSPRTGGVPVAAVDAAETSELAPASTSPVPAAVPASPQPSRKKAIEVPHLVGQPVEQAKTLLLERGLLVVLSSARNDDKVPADHVLEQTPLPGSIVHRGAEVSVVVSRGALPVELPDVTGLEVETARVTLREGGLKLGRVTTRRAEEPKGEIVEMAPLPGQKVPRGTEVSIVVSEGPELAEVPKVVKRRIGSARRKLEDAGFTPGRIVWTYHLDFEPGVIVRQDPKGGSMAPRGAEIKLWGSEPE